MCGVAIECHPASLLELESEFIIFFCPLFESLTFFYFSTYFLNFSTALRFDFMKHNSSNLRMKRVYKRRDKCIS